MDYSHHRRNYHMKSRSRRTFAWENNWFEVESGYEDFAACMRVGAIYVCIGLY